MSSHSSGSGKDPGTHVAQMSVADPVLACWQFEAHAPLTSRVVPDGCRDLIVRLLPDAPPRCFVSGLATTAYDVCSGAGDRYRGFRLQAAARFDEHALLAAAHRSAVVDDAGLLDVIRAHVRIDTRLDDALSALASTSSVQRAAAGLGVSLRTLERLVQSTTSRTPGFWRALARARQSGRLVVNGTDVSLAEAASIHGYADQAHMTREFQRWFGMSPSCLRRDADATATITQVGYG